MLRIAHKQGDVYKPVAVKNDPVNEFISMFLRDHNENIEKQKKRSARAKRLISC